MDTELITIGLTAISLLGAVWKWVATISQQLASLSKRFEQLCERFEKAEEWRQQEIGAQRASKE